MIAIINTTKDLTQKTHDYEIRINHKVVTTFQHVRAERLAKCLLLASEAVGRQEALVLNVAQELKERGQV